jgi:hypothetical protein
LNIILSFIEALSLANNAGNLNEATDVPIAVLPVFNVNLRRMRAPGPETVWKGFVDFRYFLP